MEKKDCRLKVNRAFRPSGFRLSPLNTTLSFTYFIDSLLAVNLVVDGLRPVLG